MRLIDADEMIKNLKAMKTMYDAIELDGMIKGIEERKTVDAEPVRHGRWIHCKGKSNLWYCSECGEKINYNQKRRTYNIKKRPVYEVNKRCRACGAKMDGGGENAAN